MPRNWETSNVELQDYAQSLCFDCTFIWKKPGSYGKLATIQETNECFSITVNIIYGFLPLWRGRNMLQNIISLWAVYLYLFVLMTS